MKCRPVGRKLPLCSRTASRPSGLRSRRYAKLPSLERLPVGGAPRSLRALRAAACRPWGVLTLWHLSGAARRLLVSGFAVHLVLAPAHPWGLLASQHRPRGQPVRPPIGLPQNRAKVHGAIVFCACTPRRFSYSCFKLRVNLPMLRAAFGMD